MNRWLALAFFTVGCGSGDAPTPVDPPGPGPERLVIRDGDLFDAADRPVRLRGANLKGIDEGGARDLVENLGMNFVRLRIDFEPQNRDDADPSGFTASYRAEIDTWIEVLAAQKIWILVELRANDEVTNDPLLYDPTSALFASYKTAWLYLASRYKATDWIAGYGLLAEPSANRAHREPVETLTGFQRALMEAITNEAGDTVTPFFVGPDFNYDTMQFRYDAYLTNLASYRDRLVFEVNALVPKPWIQDGSGVGEPPVYPVSDTADYAALLVPAPGEDLVAPRDLERIFNKRRQEPAHFPALMSRGFVPWYLGFAREFAERHRVPMLIDQFGASTLAGGQLAFEADVIDFAEANGFHWARWSYNAGDPSRWIAGNAAVAAFYAERAAPRAAPH